jgi:hypothetical protein
MTTLTTTTLLCVAALALSLLAEGAQAQTSRYSKQLQRACANDYKAHCGEYGIETEALRLCMDRVGHRLSKTCVNALVAEGEVSRAEVKRRKRAAR